MKILFTLIIAIAFSYPILAQHKLSFSKAAGDFTYIYKINDRETALIAEKGQIGFSESFLHTQVDSFYTAKGYKKILPFGNYVYLSSDKNNLNYHFVDKKNVDLKFINNLREFQFYITDQEGNQIVGDLVEMGRGKRPYFDKQAHLYKAGYPKKATYIKVIYQGISNYFTFQLDDQKRYSHTRNRSFFRKLTYSPPLKYAWMPFRNIFVNRHRYREQSKYKGYMVFSKPKYKPLDTVKFKAYILTAQGKEISDKTVIVKLHSNKEITLTSLKPYRNGGYEYQFVLVDSLNLKLDRSYQVLLKEKGKKAEETIITNSFYYEDYELKSLNFMVRTDKLKHQVGAPINVFMKAVDENDLTVADGRVKITALCSNVGKFGDNKIFIPDTLWKKETGLDPVGETKLTLPDSIFPKADLNFSLQLEFRNSNNESRSDSKYLSFAYQRKEEALSEIKASLKKDSIYFDYRINDQSKKINAKVISYSKDDIQLDSINIQLPNAIKINYNVDNYQLKTDAGIKENVFLSDFRPRLGIAASQNRDSLRLVIDNENKVPFWYTIFSGNQIFMKGFTNTLDTIFQHKNNQAAHISISYYWNDQEINQQASAFYNPNLLNVNLIAPDMIYPGQKVNMLVKVTDLSQKPVPNTDLTAFAITSKFRNNYFPSLPNFGKTFRVRKTKNFNLKAANLLLDETRRIDWYKWGRKLGLDTIEYYKFTHPDHVYIIQEAANDAITQISPFVVSDGAIEPVNIVYIDEIPVFFSQADQLSRYSFQVKPGKHDIKLRTYNKMVQLRNVEIPGGKKTILSVNASSNVSKDALKTGQSEIANMPNVLTAAESDWLNQYMFSVADNFGSEKTIVKADTTEHLLNAPPSVSANKDLLVGPIKQNNLVFKTKDFAQDFFKEPGYLYTFTKGLIKQKSVFGSYAFKSDLSLAEGINVDFKQYVLKRNEIDSIWNEYLDLRSHSTPLFTNRKQRPLISGRLSFSIDTAFTKRLPYIKNIILYKTDEPDFMEIYAGNNAYWPPLAPGSYRMMFLLKDNRYFTAEDIKVKANGINYYQWDKFKVAKADDFSQKLDTYIKSVKLNHYHYPSENVANEVVETFNDLNFDFKTLTGVMSGRVVSKDNRLPLPGVSIKIAGLNWGTTSKSDGTFSIRIPRKGKMTFSYIGYETLVIAVREGKVTNIELTPSTGSLAEIVVVGYGANKKSLQASAITTTVNPAPVMAGSVAGLTVTNREMIRIRGMSSISGTEKPIIIVDGLPFSGDMGLLAAEDIASVNVLSSTDATAIYGARGASGVIIVKTKKGIVGVIATGETVAQQQTMRTNFSDEGFWQPKLNTDDTGTAKFTVKFPDDITKWNVKVIAMNGRKQSGVTESLIKSFKSLSANFVSPAFAVSGDSIGVIGKLMNYNSLEEKVNRKFSLNGVAMRNDNISFRNAHIDTIIVVASGKDSLNFEYTLKQENGYFDGEIRKVPVFDQGVNETKGYFSALLRDTAVNYAFDQKLGRIMLRAESTIFPTLLDEMTKLRNYEYLCNEQLASKLKALLLEQSVRKYLNQPFNHQKDILFIIKRLQQNKKPQGTWAWWQNGEEQIWISLHVVDALLKAEKLGYKIDLNKQTLYTYLVKELNDDRNYDQMQTIKLLHLLDNRYYIKDWVLAFEKQKTERKPSLYESLELMELRQMAGLKVDIDALLKLKKETMFGNTYWGEDNIRFWDNSIQNTLLAYKVLKSEGKYDQELEKIVLYFLEQRKNGQWRNTFESALILETILPELLVKPDNTEPATLKINNETISTFPYDKVMENTTAVSLVKTGKMPVYFTAFQQFQNAKPAQVSKGFSVITSFVQAGNTVTKLKAGVLTRLKVEVAVHADADYVMIEIPIPAGCSYENKKQSFWGVETHREYFKNKTSIFCTKLKRGKYTFEVDLMPRYGGSYTLNPAKAEMMYFPVFYGREEMKKVGIN